MSKRLTWLAVVLVILPLIAWSDNDCAIADEYYQLSKSARTEYRQDDAFVFLKRASVACPTYQYLQELAEIAVELGDPEHDNLAAESFDQALQLATTDAQQARSIAHYAELLFRHDDPQNAMKYIFEARNLDPQSEWIAQLAQQITSRAAKVTPTDIERGLADMAFKPLQLRLLPTIDSPTEPGAGATGPEAVTTSLRPRSINIPLNFRVNSTMLDEDTRENLNVLAETLVQEKFAGQQFMFIGHADVRGDANTNFMLSVQRANSIFGAIKILQPSLTDRIVTGGKGEMQPLAKGLTEADHYANRRLEIILIPPQ